MASPPSGVRLGGVLGEALAANLRGRLMHFIVDEGSPPIAIFSADRVNANREGDWYGEHAGKWLYAAAKAAARTRDAQLEARVRRVADYLVDRQEADGYLGTYAPERRFMQRQPPKPRSWDGAPSVRTWDIWTHCYLILGLLEVHRHLHGPRYLDAARRIGDLCWRTLDDDGIDITELGNHHGLSATVLMDAAIELHFAVGGRRYLELALLILRQADRNPDLALLSKALAGSDASEIATGKAYQLAWNLVGLAKLHRATGDAVYLQAVERLWQSIREHHLSLGGGPWGGVAHRSREVFNPAGVFSPQGYVETCSTLAWIQLNRELLAISGEAKYAEEIERSAYNDLLGAQAADGEDWCYYSFPNGQRVHTTYWRCCKSSGAMALEELPAIACTQGPDSHLRVNLYGPGTACFTLPQARGVRLEQSTAYPFDGAVTIRVTPEQVAHFTISLRIPAWAHGAAVTLNGVEVAAAVVPGTYLAIDRTWRAGDRIALDFPMPVQLHRRLNRNTQESRAPDGSPVHQQVLRYEYAAITRGPLVYATGLIDGFKTEETIRLPAAPAADWIDVLAPAPEEAGPAIRMRLGYRPALLFLPYYRAGGREHGDWRLTWLSLAPDSPALPD
ncbi:MAG TPA: beta-L-arabinofuranosidase domain-containing protein [Dokdonella sp.]